MVQIEQDILAKNNQHARFNREFLAERGIFAVNLVSSPGSGKTTLLTESIKRLLPCPAGHGDRGRPADRQRRRAHPRDRRAARCRSTPARAATWTRAWWSARSSGCSRPTESVLFIENVGNLVCPAAFDLGEAHKVVVLSVTEGEDKPLKYPDMFKAATLMLLNKVDLLPYLTFDVAKCIEYARRVNPASR